MRGQVGDGPNPRLPLYALWMLEACVRRPVVGPEGETMETFIKCGGLDQVQYTWNPRYTWNPNDWSPLMSSLMAMFTSASTSARHGCLDELGDSSLSWVRTLSRLFETSMASFLIASAFFLCALGNVRSTSTVSPSTQNVRLEAATGQALMVYSKPQQREKNMSQ